MVFPEFDEFDKIWISYRMFKREAEVVRSGYYLCGIYPEPTEESAKRRSESDLEHSAGLAHLVSDMAVWCPGLFPNPFLATKVAMAHDIGEIYIGDIADDGNRDHDVKDAEELEVFLEYVLNQPENIQDEILSYYEEFQTRSTPRGIVMYIADKLEAVLQLLNYEFQGKYGDVRLKEPPSERDLKFAEIIGTSNSTDVWAYHFKTLIDDYPSEMTLPFICVLDSAVNDVRGEWFPWWTFWRQKRIDWTTMG